VRTTLTVQYITCASQASCLPTRRHPHHQKKNTHQAGRASAQLPPQPHIHCVQHTTYHRARAFTQTHTSSPQKATHSPGKACIGSASAIASHPRCATHHISLCSCIHTNTHTHAHHKNTHTHQAERASAQLLLQRLLPPLARFDCVDDGAWMMEREGCARQ
jgi:hypothetical protein